MYIYLKYGDGEKMIVNPDCTTKNLLEYVRCKCDCLKTSIVDLCDETGIVKNLSELSDMDSAMALLEDRATYIPILIEKNEENLSKSYMPLLEQYETSYPDLKKKLRDQCTDEKHGKNSGKKKSQEGKKHRNRDSSAKKK